MLPALMNDIFYFVERPYNLKNNYTLERKRDHTIYLRSDYDLYFFHLATLVKKRLWHRCFPVNSAKFLRTPFFIEYLLRMLLSCGSRYVGETKCNVEVSWNEHDNPTKSSEQLKHL